MGQVNKLNPSKLTECTMSTQTTNLRKKETTGGEAILEEVITSGIDPQTLLPVRTLQSSPKSEREDRKNVVLISFARSLKYGAIRSIEE